MRDQLVPLGLSEACVFIAGFNEVINCLISMISLDLASEDGSRRKIGAAFVLIAAKKAVTP